MKKITRQFFVAAVALTAFTACTDANLAEESSFDPFVGQSMNTAVLTDANCQKVSNVSSNFGTYYLNIKTDGIWYIETADNMEFTPTKMFGRGNARVPVMIGNNWTDVRQLSYKVNILDENGQPLPAATRADGDGTQTVTQDANANLADFSKLVNSNIFVGYGYNPTKSLSPELRTGIEIFDMKTLNTNGTHVVNTLAPQANEVYYLSHSESVMDKIIGVNVSPGGNFNVVKFDTLGVDVKTNDIKHTGQTVIQKTLTRGLYSRELAWANAKSDQNNFSAGFKYYKTRFIEQLKAAGNDETKKKEAADEFFSVVGTHFISKALLGCELHYRLNVDSSKTQKSTEVKVALDFKWQQQVKDTAGVDSALQKKLLEQNANLKNFVFKAGVEVTDVTYKAANSTKASVKARGGDVQLVSMLATGGSLLCEDLAKWLLGTQAEKATMVGFTSVPIYQLFDASATANADEKSAHDYLKKIIDASFNLDSEKFKFGQITD